VDRGAARRSRRGPLRSEHLPRDRAGLPAPTVIASTDPDTARLFQQLLGTPMFRAYTNEDVVGVELCGALKNIVALGAGAIDGMGYGVNAKAGFMTRGLAEIARYAFASGANPLTCAGLAGFGDLIATCTSAHSRNRTVGELLAKGSTIADIKRRLGGQVAEGIGTTEAVHGLAAAKGVDMPIAAETYRVLFEGKPVREAMRGLMERERGEELSGPLAEVSRLCGSVRETLGDRADEDVDLGIRSHGGDMEIERRRRCAHCDQEDRRDDQEHHADRDQFALHLARLASVRSVVHARCEAGK